ncbi:MAG TPA: alanine--tRNA ligase, partial [Amaricoccus sp.]|uniref:alanine--tRNA ligase n=1 Tax=Amaricoccus sp. TaxID=1872485 RepID=UPI002CC1ADC3
MASLNDIRSTFLDYFAAQGHRVVPSSPLVPRNDPTLMFTNAGMVQFKNVFTGLEKRDYVRAATSQKCVRAGGKHNDLDNVGYTARHHTFFEMLGNFSFGDYFKEGAIPFAWELLTREFGLPKERLLVTVYHDDDDAAAIWKKVAGLPDERIIRIPTMDNFWMMGPTGPCGPCSEIFYDHGEGIPGGPPGSPDEDGDRFVEIWNLVFMQFEQFEDGARVPLPRPSIDTGMGLERVGAVLQGKHDNYDTDLMRALIEASAQATHSDPDGPGKVHHRVIADHLRSTSFLIADGVLPSNEGRGYVLRRIMRRAMRHAHLLGAEDPVMWRLVPALVAQMGRAFPELPRAQALIEETLLSEETRFKATLERGLRMLDDELGRLPSGAALPGATAFRLYDTYGFPLDLTQDALREKGRVVDTQGFEAAMAEQKAKARAAWAGSGEAADEAIWFDLAERHGPTEFLGYDTEAAEGQVLALVVGGRPVATAGIGVEVQVVLNQTPFYAEQGGQVGDAGVLRTDKGRVRVTDVRKKAGLFVHQGRVEEGELAQGAAAELVVDHERRAAIRANHSATHLLHEALRRALGEHVAQRGSLVAPDRLRFDFAHPKAMTAEEQARVEAEVNAYVRQNTPVETRIMTPEAAERLGARALFGEKYGDEVRVVAMGARPGSGLGAAGDTYSLELCGGTHVARTGDIGTFRLVSEAASASGVRRVEALTGEGARRQIAADEAALAEAAGLLRARPDELAERVRALLDERKAQGAEIAELRRRLAMAGGPAEAKGPETVAGVPFLAQTLAGVSGKDLRGLIDEHKARLGSGVVLLVADTGG